MHLATACASLWPQAAVGPVGDAKEPIYAATTTTDPGIGLMLMAAGLCIYIGCLWTREQWGRQSD